MANRQAVTRHHLIPVQAGGTDHPCNLRLKPADQHADWHALFRHRQTVQVFRLLLDIWTIDGLPINKIAVVHDGRELVLKCRPSWVQAVRPIKRTVLKRLFGRKKPVEILQHVLDEWAPPGVFARCRVYTDGGIIELDVHQTVDLQPGQGHPALARPMTDRRRLVNVRDRLRQLSRSH